MLEHMGLNSISEAKKPEEVSERAATPRTKTDAVIGACLEHPEKEFTKGRHALSPRGKG